MPAAFATRRTVHGRSDDRRLATRRSKTSEARLPVLLPLLSHDLGKMGGSRLLIWLLQLLIVGGFILRHPAPRSVTTQPTEQFSFSSQLEKANTFFPDKNCTEAYLLAGFLLEAESAVNLKVMQTKMEGESAVEAMQAKCETRYQCLDAMRKSDLATITQRYALELLFGWTLDAVRRNKGVLQALEKSVLSPSTKAMLKHRNCKMTIINEALAGDAGFRDAVWADLNIHPTVSLPLFPTDLLYGRLSSDIHHPPFDSVYVSDLESYKVPFFQVVADKMQPQRRVVEYSAGLVAMGKQLQLTTFVQGK